MLFKKIFGWEREQMNLLYRMFFLILCMAGVMLLSMPLVLLVRLLLRRHRRKYVMWEWRFVYLRAVCPLAMTSILLLIPGLNYKFHRFLTSLGFTMEDAGGTVFHWKDIFTSSISTNITFKGCSLIWAAGVVILLLHLIVTQRRLGIYFSGAKEMGEDIFESSVIELPVQRGIFRKKIYLPKGYQTGETAWLLRHMESRHREPLRRFLVVFITVIYWFHPVMWLYLYLWNRDNEIEADEKIVYRKQDILRLKYAQGILNFRKSKRYVKDENGKYVEKKSQNIFSFLTIYERNPEERAKRMMYQKWYTTGRGFSAFVWLSVLCFLLFLFSPLRMAWSGGTWSSSTQKDSGKEESLFAEGNNLVVAKTDTLSPEGLSRMMQLEMKKGAKDSEDGYDGTFVLTMYDKMGEKISSLDMDDIFSKSPMKTYHFSIGMTLQISDYNGDGTQEITLGQKKALTDQEFRSLFPDREEKDIPKIQDYQVYEYSVIGIEDKELPVIQEGITVVTKDKDHSESMLFDTVEDVPNIFYVNLAGDRQYYEWDETEQTYVAKKYSEEDIENKKKGEEGDTQESASDHTLTTADGTTAVMVSTKRDSSSNEAIEAVYLSPRNSQVKFDDIKGYFCDLMWVPVTNTQDTERYAMLIYNGMKARTFVIYDTKTKSVYHKQEDGAENLGKVFKQFHEEDITFQESGAVIYSLAEKNSDTLKIQFSAQADGDVTVKGSYEYSVKEKKSANLQFTRTVENSTSAPTPETE